MIATLPCRPRARGDPGDGRVRRPRRLPGGRRRGSGDDHVARRHRHQGLRPRGGDRALRRPARAGAGPDRAQGRHLRQHPRGSGDRRQDRRPAPAASSARSRRCWTTSTRSRARSASRTSPSTPTTPGSRSSSRRWSTTIEVPIDVRKEARAKPDRSRLREVAAEFELRPVIQRLDEEFLRTCPTAPWRRRSVVEAEEGTPADLADGPIAIAVAAGIWAASDGDRVVTGDASDLVAAGGAASRPAADRARREVAGRRRARQVCWRSPRPAAWT